MIRRLGVAGVKAHLAEILREVENRGERVVIERRGRPVAVIQPYHPSAETPPLHWARALRGIAAGIEDFEQVMDEVVKTREKARPRPVNLDD